MKTLTLMGSAALAALLICTHPAAAQKAKDTVRIPLLQPVSGVDDYLDPGPEPDFRTKAVFDSLITFDEDENKFVGLLAKSWRRLDDVTYEFDLRDDVVWHDGKKLDADDVVYTLNWGVNPDVKLRSKRNFEWIKKVEKLSQFKIRITAAQPTAEAEAILGSEIYILPAHVHGKFPPNDTLAFGFKPVGTGPFTAADVDRNKGIFLKKNPGYQHGNSANPPAHIGNMNLIFMPDFDVQIAQFLTGNLDMLVRITIDQTDFLEKQPGVVAKLIQGGSVSYLALDAAGKSKNKAMADPRVRKAIFMAMDRREFYKLEAGDRKLNRGAPEAMCYEDQMGCAYSVKQPDFDVAGAKRLLSEAGYPNGLDLEIATYTSAVQNHAVVAAGLLSKIGIRTKIEKYTIAIHRSAMRDNKIEAFVGGYPIAGLPDVTNTVTSFFDVPDSNDYHGDKELKQMAKQMSAVLDPDTRKELGRRMFDAATERFYFMPLGPRPQSVVYRDELEVKLSRYMVIGLSPGDIYWK